MMNSTAKTWWGEKFMHALCSFIDKDRLTRGRAYRSSERIMAYTQKDNKVVAKIKGNKNPYYGIYETPYYKTEITFVPLENWEDILDDTAKDLLVLAKLATKELPSSVAILLPKSSQDMQTHCSCPDWENPCKHIAGLYYRLAEELDFDPFLLLKLRGIPPKELEKRLQCFMNKPKSAVLPLEKKKHAPEMGTDIKLRDFWGLPHKLKEPETMGIIPLSQPGTKLVILQWVTKLLTNRHI